MQHNNLSPLAERVWVFLLQLAPLRSYTRLVRVASRIPLPRGLRKPVFGRVAVRLGIDLAEAEQMISDYRCFGDLFVRRLHRHCRPIDTCPDTVVSPVDGALSALGSARQGGLIQAKGITYPVEELLRSEDLTRRLNGGTFVNLYLRPKDYHRVHCPISGRVTAIRHIDGTLFPVKPYMVRSLAGIFVRNERIVFELETPVGSMALVCVSAAGVGNTSIEIPTPGGNSHFPASGIPVEKGQELARFNLGSTVILLFQPGRVALEPMMVGQEVQMGRVLARRVDQSIEVAPEETQLDRV